MKCDQPLESDKYGSQKRAHGIKFKVFHSFPFVYGKCFAFVWKSAFFSINWNVGVIY